MLPLYKAISKRLAVWQGRKVIAGLCLLAVIWSAFLGGWTERQVQINDNGKVKTLVTRHWTVGEALKEAGIRIQPQDLVFPGPEALIWPGLAVMITRAVPVLVEVGGRQEFVKVPVPTVGAVLAQQGITLKPGDKVETNLGSGQENLYVRVINRQEEIELVEEKLPFSVIKRPHYRLVEGSERVVQEGKEGLKFYKYKVIKENGLEVKRELIDTWVEVKPQPKIIAYGTREWPETAARAGQVLEVIATAYTHTGNPTATGIYPHRGIVAVDPSLIPLGTKLYVEGYGYAEAQDTGGLIIGRRIDVFMESEEEAIQWGRKRVKVKILGI
ncbi:MAG: hypothetical protein PWP65_95 [Clostridia bacterium]|nr:hypothetical protein [Clostridia bacterium]